MEFFRPEYWSGQLFPSPGDLPNPGIEHRSPALEADSLPAESPGKPLTIQQFCSGYINKRIENGPNRYLYPHTCTPIFIAALFTITKR